MTWNIFLASGDIINVVVLDAALASPTAVIRGSVQLVAAIATQLQAYSASALSTVSRSAWQQVRTQLQKYQQQRVQQRQFRRSPTTYLASLEQKLLQLVLPP